MIVKRNQLYLGTANDGAFLSSVVNEDHLLFSFFEKRVKESSSELMLCRQLFSAKMSNDPFLSVIGIGPAIQGVVTIYMDYLEGAGEFDLSQIPRDSNYEDRIETLVNNIAEGLKELNAYVQAHISRIGSYETQFSRFLARREDAIDKSIFETLKKIDVLFRDSVSAGYSVVSHNDLHFHNMWVGETDLRVKLLDYGLFGTNYIGSDLHHFYNIHRTGRDSEVFFFDRLVKSYSRTFSLSTDFIRHSACYYAIVRLVGRLWAKGTLNEWADRKLDLFVDDFFALNDLVDTRS